MNEIHYRQLCNIENFNIYLLVNKFYQQDFTYHIKLLLKIKLNNYEHNVNQHSNLINKNNIMNRMVVKNQKINSVPICL